MSDLDAVTNTSEAARLRMDHEHVLRSPGASQGERANARARLRELDERYPDAHHESLISTHAELYGDHGAPPGHNATRSAMRREAGMSAAQAAQHRKQRAGTGGEKKQKPAATPPSRAARAGAGARRGYRSRPSRALGVPAVGGGIGDTLLAGTRIGLGLALLYFVLNPRGSRALSTVLNTSGGMLRLFFAPIDPLAPGTVAQLARAGAGPRAANPVNRTERGIAAGRLAGPQAPTYAAPLPASGLAHGGTGAQTVTGSRASRTARRNSHPVRRP